jgi:prepilin-type N-terminal cleavage/methylation domain-containing protein
VLCNLVFSTLNTAFAAVAEFVLGRPQQHGVYSFVPISSSQRGFTLAEALIAVTIVGIIATMTIPTILVETQDNNSFIRVKALCQRLMEASSRLENVSPDNLDPTGEELLQFTNFSTRKTDGSTLLTGSTQACSEDFPCYQFSDGSVVQTNNVPPNQDDYTYFNIDPDGERGPREAMTVVYDHEMGRLTSYDALLADGFTSTPPASFVPFNDPEYAQKWTEPAGS